MVGALPGMRAAAVWVRAGASGSAAMRVDFAECRVAAALALRGAGATGRLSSATGFSASGRGSAATREGFGRAGFVEASVAGFGRAEANLATTGFLATDVEPMALEGSASAVDAAVAGGFLGVAAVVSAGVDAVVLRAAMARPERCGFAGPAWGVSASAGAAAI